MSTDNNSINNTTQDSPKRTKVLFPLVAMVVGAILLVGSFGVILRNRNNDTDKLPSPTPTFSQEEFDQFFETDIRPALQAYATRNQDAVDRAIKEIRRDFFKYRKGIPAFVKDITSWGTRFGVIGRGFKDWTKNSDEVQFYIHDKFRQHIMAETELYNLFNNLSKQLQDDLQASQNQLYVDVKTAINRHDIHFQHLPSVTNVVSDIGKTAAEMTKELSSQSVVAGVTTLIGGFILEESATFITKTIIDQVVIQLSALLATSSTASGGATGAGGAAGGVGGSSLGPAGTVLGFAAGLAVGVVVDAWMADKAQAELEIECYDLLDTMEKAIITGFHRETKPGVLVIFSETTRLLEEGHEQAIYSALQEVYQ